MGDDVYYSTGLARRQVHRAGFLNHRVCWGNAIFIAPALVVAGGSDAETDYANVNAAAADTAEIVFLNTTTVQSNIFFMNDSIEIFSGKLAFPTEGLVVSRMSTDSGIEIIFARQGDVLTGKTTYRMTMFFGVTNLNPEMNGVLIGSQV